MPGPAWQAFDASSRGEFAVLLIDEVDKTNPGFDAFLLRLLEDWTFRSPSGDEVKADPSKICVVLTSNGRRALRPEVLRRCQRVHIPLPERERLEQIISQIAGVKIPPKLMDLVIRLGQAISQEDAEAAPSPKEMALCCVDLLALTDTGEHKSEIWRAVAASWLVKGPDGAKVIDKAARYNWAKALKAEAGLETTASGDQNSPYGKGGITLLQQLEEKVAREE